MASRTAAAANASSANEGVTLAAFFARVRRRFYELHVNESSHLATQTATTIAGLWEADIRGQDLATRRCPACPANPNSPRHSTMPYLGALLSSAS